jgi:hypothetical protein
MMPSYLFARRNRASFGEIDLQIIQRVPQVKAGDGACGFRISLGFKQLARRLHVAFARWLAA